MNLAELTTKALKEANTLIKDIHQFEFDDLVMYDNSSFISFKFTTPKYNGIFSYSINGGTKNSLTIHETNSK